MRQHKSNKFLPARRPDGGGNLSNISLPSNDDRVSERLSLLIHAINSRRKTMTYQDQRSNSIGSMFDSNYGLNPVGSSDEVKKQVNINSGQDNSSMMRRAPNSSDLSQTLLNYRFNGGNQGVN